MNAMILTFALALQVPPAPSNRFHRNGPGPLLDDGSECQPQSASDASSQG